VRARLTLVVGFHLPHLSTSTPHMSGEQAGTSQGGGGEERTSGGGRRAKICLSLSLSLDLCRLSKGRGTRIAKQAILNCSTQHRHTIETRRLYTQ
jgi:hypothetical protein